MTFTLEETHGGGGIDLVVTGRWRRLREGGREVSWVPGVGVDSHASDEHRTVDD